MPKPKALKVFRTPIGFHDAYVAAPTKKAALAAWGSHRNLFALGEAEQVADPKLMKAPLAAPGSVIKVSRGSTAEQLKALPPDEKRKAKPPATERPTRPINASRKKPIPRPSRSTLDQAEASLAALSAANAQRLAKIDDEIETLRQRREALAARQSGAQAVRETAVERAQKAYDDQLEKWRSDG